MDKYKVILVDDEAEVIDVIEQKIAWNELGFEVVGSATNGVKAIELVEKTQPDVVITDIKMPYMDGLELSKRLNDDYRNIHIIIFTGFDEFEYAKQCIGLGITDYLLKPIDQEKLQIVLERILGDGAGILENEQELLAPSTIRKIMDEIKEHYTENITLTGLAEKYAISVSYLSELLKEHLQLSFSEYISSKRIQKAKELLADESLSIEQIAEQTGYNDYFYFTKVFKKNTGISPSKYRKNLLEH